MSAQRLALVYGGSGQLGRVVCNAFAKASFKVVAVDFKENADANTFVKISGDPKEDAATVLKALGDEKLDAVVNVAGGWAGGGIGSDSIFESARKMFSYNVDSSLAAAHIAAKALRGDDRSLLVLTGATAALSATPGMLGYGMSKAAVHHLLLSLTAAKGKKNGLPGESTAICISPVTLDTPTNRESMPNADTSTWTPLDELANTLVSWADGKDRPRNGALVSVVTKDNKTEYIDVSEEEVNGESRKRAKV